MALAAVARSSLSPHVSASLLQQLRGICSTALAALHQSTRSSAAAAAAAAAAPQTVGVQPELTKMNLCNAINSALHIAMAENPK